MLDLENIISYVITGLFYILAIVIGAAIRTNKVINNKIYDLSDWLENSFAPLPFIGLLIQFIPKPSPRIKIIGKLTYNTQGSGNLIVYRIPIQNIGKADGDNVRITVREIIENGTKRKNFTPMPLNWTHIGTKRLLKSKEDPAMLDLVTLHRHNGIKSWTALRLATDKGSGIPDFTDINPGETTLSLASNTGEKFEAKIFWKLGDKPNINIYNDTSR